MIGADRAAMGIDHAHEPPKAVVGEAAAGIIRRAGKAHDAILSVPFVGVPAEDDGAAIGITTAGSDRIGV